MEVPVIPTSVKEFLYNEGIQTNYVSWNIHDNKRTISLTMTWPRKSFGNNMESAQPTASQAQSASSQGPRKKPGKRGDTRKQPPSTPSVVKDHSRSTRHNSASGTQSSVPDSPHKSITPKKKKSPSRLKRDRRRMCDFRKRKSSEKNNTKYPTLTLDHFEAELYKIEKMCNISNVIEYISEDQITNFPANAKSWSTPLEPTTTVYEVKSLLFAHLKDGLELPIPSLTSIKILLEPFPNADFSELDNHILIKDIWKDKSTPKPCFLYSILLDLDTDSLEEC